MPLTSSVPNLIFGDRVCQPRSWVPHQCLMARRISLHLRDVVRAWSRCAVWIGWNIQGGSHMQRSMFLDSGVPLAGVTRVKGRPRKRKHTWLTCYNILCPEAVHRRDHNVISLV